MIIRYFFLLNDIPDNLAKFQIEMSNPKKAVAGKKQYTIGVCYSCIDVGRGEMIEEKKPLMWITGASTGIGRALALEVKGDYRLALSARSEDLLGKLASEINSNGGNAKAYVCDVTDSDAVSIQHQKLVSELGDVDVLVANAGGHVRIPVTEFSAQKVSDIMKLNYEGVLNCIEAVLPSMIARSKGHIVGVSSVAGYRGLPEAWGYCASKAALSCFLEGLRFDLEPYRIAVTVVSPGFVKTPLTDRNDYPMPFLMSAERAAQIISKGIKQRKLEIHFPWRMSLFLKTLRMLPHPIYHFLIKKNVVDKRRKLR